MTAVEWYAEEFAEHLEETYGVKITSLTLLSKAKEMEKQQLYNFYVQGGIDCVTQADRTVEDFYNDTFKSK